MFTASWFVRFGFLILLLLIVTLLLYSVPEVYGMSDKLWAGGFVIIAALLILLPNLDKK